MSRTFLVDLVCVDGEALEGRAAAHMCLHKVPAHSSCQSHPHFAMPRASGEHVRHAKIKDNEGSLWKGHEGRCAVCKAGLTTLAHTDACQLNPAIDDGSPRKQQTTTTCMKVGPSVQASRRTAASAPLGQRFHEQLVHDKAEDSCEERHARLICRHDCVHQLTALPDGFQHKQRTRPFARLLTSRHVGANSTDLQQC